MRGRFIILLLLFAVGVNAQQIAVKSFRKLDSDLSARGSEGRTDQNGDRCAIIKVVTTENGFVFEPDALGLVGSVRKTGEIWLYVPYGAKRLTIKHDQLGVLRDYLYPERIEKACVYEMVLTTGRVVTTVEEEIAGQWLVITAEPRGATVYIDDVYEAATEGMVQKFVSFGRHTYRVEHALYHSEAGQLEVKADQKAELQVKLKPAFGYIEVNSVPESGARVLIDGKEVGITPYRSEALASGEHSVEVLKVLYQPVRKIVTVKDGETAQTTMELSANYGELQLTTAAVAELWINNERKGKGQWSGRLNAGMYVVEARQPSHRTVRQSVEIKAGETHALTLADPQPIYGMLNISSTPGKATIWLNGIEYGRTPLVIKEVLVGKQLLELSKPGCATVRQEVMVEEGKVLPVQLTLPSGRNVVIRTDGEGDSLYVDGKAVGVSPQQLELAYGTHFVRAQRQGHSIEGELKVAGKEGEIVFSLTFGLSAKAKWAASVTEKQKQVLSRLIDHMVKVEGGTFRMGATPEQGHFITLNEQPVHTVVLSDYYIGQYEITQTEWEVVMGSNPALFKGENYPVERVSRTDCELFIRRLKDLTGLNFNLPTEAQWEYAARGGKKSRGFLYAGSNSPETVAWYTDNSQGHTHAVGQKVPNELGLYDMSGNVWEWCRDIYGDYPSQTWVDPTGPARGEKYVFRGGCWNEEVGNCRVALRNYWTSDYRHSVLGLRLVLEK